MPGDIDVPGGHTVRICIPSAMTGAAADDEWSGFVTPSDTEALVTITKATWIPSAAVAHNAAAYTTLAVRDRKADASGAELLATRSYAAGDSVAFVAEVMTLDPTPANLVIAGGHVITVQRVHTGAGLVLPAGIVEVTYQFS